MSAVDPVAAAVNPSPMTEIPTHALRSLRFAYETRCLSIRDVADFFATLDGSQP